MPSPLELYDRILNAVSFSGELYKLRRELNLRIDLPDTIPPPPRSHPLGVANRYKKRRITIAEALLLIVNDSDPGHARNRHRALRMLMNAASHAKTLDLPLNTARVQVALVKEAIKHRNDKRKQLELLHDFSVASHGQSHVIGTLCDELNIIEVPETGENLCELGLGWDSHVHDTATSGRKNPTQLVVDAFIKGISELTIAYSSPASSDAMEEAIDSGRIAGIKVRVALEFSLLFSGRRFHFMALLPDMRKGGDLRRFLRDNRHGLESFLEGLERNQENRVDSVRRLLDTFNKSTRYEVNHGYPEGELYQLPKLRLKDFEAFIGLSGVNRIHLGEILFSTYLPVFFNRVLYLRVRRETARRELAKGRIAEGEFARIERQYAEAYREYSDTTPEHLRKRYFDDTESGDYLTVFDDLAKIRKQLVASGCLLKVLHPLEHGGDKARKLLEKNRGSVDQVEIYNTQDCANRDPDEILEFCRFVNALNLKGEQDGKGSFIPVCGSDATGRIPEIPGMGFIFASVVGGKRRHRYLGRHTSLPPLVSSMIRSGSAPVTEGDAARGGEIVSMGKRSALPANRLGDETEIASPAIGPGRAWRYLNPALLGLVRVATGFAVAAHFIGFSYAALWLGITGIRNVVADVLSSRGVRLSEWTLRSVNFTNVALSLFWTGFSVPILGFVKSGFDLAWPLPTEGFVFDLAKFFCIAFANGLYLVAHNTLRGFDRKVIGANFFRTIISWPFAVLFSPAGTILGIPSIVQSKFWSDVVAGFVEGGGKYLKTLSLRRRDLEEIVPRVAKGEGDDRCTALLDLLYLFRGEPHTRKSLRSILGFSALGQRTHAEGEARETWRMLLETLGNDAIIRELSDFILAGYSSEVAVDLTDLVAGTLPGFVDWLESGGRRASRIRAKAPSGGKIDTVPFFP